MLQRSLILLKPDCVQRQFAGEIITRFEKVGLKIVGMKMVFKDKDFYAKHYAEMAQRKGIDILKRSQNSMTEGPVIAMVIEGWQGIEVARKLAGPTEAFNAPPGTIRGDYSHQNYALADAQDVGIKNLLHASADEKDAKFEINLWFTPEELHSYKTVHEVHLF